MSLEQEFGQSLGVVSHLFVVWRVVAERGQAFSYYVVLICCWWLSLGQQTMIKRSEVVKLTGLSARTVFNHLQTAFRAGYLSRYRSRGHYYLSVAGSEHMREFFDVVLAAVVDLYDDNK